MRLAKSCLTPGRAFESHPSCHRLWHLHLCSFIMATRLRPVSLGTFNIPLKLLPDNYFICRSRRAANAARWSGDPASWADTWWRSCWSGATLSLCLTSGRATSCQASPFTKETSATSRWDHDLRHSRLCGVQGTGSSKLLVFFVIHMPTWIGKKELTMKK